MAEFTALLLAALPGNVLSPLVAAALGTVLGVLVTGAFHEDGLADVFDGLGGSPDKARALIIMKDSRVGAFGAMAVMLVLLAKVALLALLGSVSGVLMCVALFLAHVVSRTWPLLLIRLMPHVGDAAGSKSKPLAEQISIQSLLTSFLWCFGALGGVLYVHGSSTLIAINIAGFNLWAAISSALALSALAWGLMGRWFWRRLQGFTGDCLGATQQVCELAFYLGLAVSL